jgi:hypothetical protein
MLKEEVGTEYTFGIDRGGRFEKLKIKLEDIY